MSSHWPGRADGAIRKLLIMPWLELTSQDQWLQLLEKSAETPVVFFKHSTRCSISSMALNRLQSSLSESEMESAHWVLLDLLKHRDISNTIAEALDVEHQSPQVLLVKGGSCTYHESHSGIYKESILDRL